MKIKINRLVIEAFKFNIVMTLTNFIFSRLGFYGEPFENTYVFDDKILPAYWTDIMIILIYLVFSFAIFIDLKKNKRNWDYIYLIDKKIVILLNIVSISGIIIAVCYLIQNTHLNSVLFFLVMEIIIFLLSISLINFKRYKKS